MLCHFWPLCFQMRNTFLNWCAPIGNMPWLSGCFWEFFSLIFQKFNYDISYYLSLVFLFMVHLASWVCSFVFFAKLELFSHCFLKYSFSLLISYPSEALIIQTLEYFIIPQVPRGLFPFSLFYLCCSKCVTYIVCPQVYVLCHLQSTIKPIQQVIYFSYCNF